MATNQAPSGASKRKMFSAILPQSKRPNSGAEPGTVLWPPPTTSGGASVPILRLPENQETVTVLVAGQPGRVVEIWTPPTLRLLNIRSESEAVSITVSVAGQPEHVVEIRTPPTLRSMNVRSESEAVSTVQLHRLPSLLHHFGCENIDVLATGNIFAACTNLKTLRIADS